MKKKYAFYYIRDEEFKPMITVCIRCYGDYTMIGTAICSPKDNPCKKKGRDIAFGRTFQKRKSEVNKVPKIQSVSPFLKKELTKEHITELYRILDYRVLSSTKKLSPIQKWIIERIRKSYLKAP